MHFFILGMDGTPGLAADRNPHGRAVSQHIMSHIGSVVRHTAVLSQDIHGIYPVNARSTQPVVYISSAVFDGQIVRIGRKVSDPVLRSGQIGFKFLKAEEEDLLLRIRTTLSAINRVIVIDQIRQQDPFLLFPGKGPLIENIITPVSGMQIVQFRFRTTLAIPAQRDGFR